MPIKVVHIGLPHTGIGTYIRAIVENIDPMRFENVLIGGKEKFEAFIQKDGSGIRSYHVRFSREIDVFQDPMSLLATVRILLKEKPDLVHAHSSKCGFIGRIAAMFIRTAVLYTPNAFSFLSSEGIKANVYLLLERMFRFAPGKLLACSTSEYELGITRVGFPKGKALIWSNSIPDPNFLAGKYSNMLPPHFIVIVGRPSFQKNLSLALKAFELICRSTKDLHLVVLTGGISEDENNSFLRSMPLRCQERILVLGDLPRTDALEVISKSKVLLSTSRYEGLPFSVLEAFAAGKPCVLTDVLGNRDCIGTSGAGFLVEEDENKIAEKVKLLLNDSELYHEMGIKARELFLSKFNIAETISDLEEIYESEIAGRNGLE